jgi:hypothetical protein
MRNNIRAYFRRIGIKKLQLDTVRPFVLATLFEHRSDMLDSRVVRANCGVDKLHLVVCRLDATRKTYQYRDNHRSLKPDLSPHHAAALSNEGMAASPQREANGRTTPSHE